MLKQLLTQRDCGDLFNSQQSTHWANMKTKSWRLTATGYPTKSASSLYREREPHASQYKFPPSLPIVESGAAKSWRTAQIKCPDNTCAGNTVDISTENAAAPVCINIKPAHTTQPKCEINHMRGSAGSGKHSFWLSTSEKPEKTNIVPNVLWILPARNGTSLSLPINRKAGREHLQGDLQVSRLRK